MMAGGTEDCTMDVDNGDEIPMYADGVKHRLLDVFKNMVNKIT